MKIFQYWWSLTRPKTPFWKVFWLFWIAPSSLIGLVGMMGLLFMKLHWFVGVTETVSFSQRAHQIAQVMNIIRLPFDFLGAYFIYQARFRCSWVYFAILGIVLSSFSALSGLISLMHFFT